MSDVVSQEFMLEFFRENRALHERTVERLDRIEHPLGTMGDHLSALVRSDMVRDAEFAAPEARLARVERRLELHCGDA